MKGLTKKAQGLMTALAQEEGRKSGSTELVPEHVLLALLKAADGFGFALLHRTKKGVSLTAAGEKLMPAVRSFLQQERVWLRDHERYGAGHPAQRRRYEPNERDGFQQLKPTRPARHFRRNVGEGC